MSGPDSLVESPQLAIVAPDNQVGGAGNFAGHKVARVLELASMPDCLHKGFKQFLDHLQDGNQGLALKAQSAVSKELLFASEKSLPPSCEQTLLPSRIARLSRQCTMRTEVCEPAEYDNGHSRACGCHDLV